MGYTYRRIMVRVFKKFGLDLRPSSRIECDPGCDRCCDYLELRLFMDKVGLDERSFGDKELTRPRI